MIQKNLQLLHIHLLSAAFSALDMFTCIYLMRNNIMLTCTLRNNDIDCLSALIFHDICDTLIHSANTVDRVIPVL